MTHPSFRTNQQRLVPVDSSRHAKEGNIKKKKKKKKKNDRTWPNDQAQRKWRAPTKTNTWEMKWWRGKQ